MDLTAGGEYAHKLETYLVHKVGVRRGKDWSMQDIYPRGSLMLINETQGTSTVIREERGWLCAGCNTKV